MTTETDWRTISISKQSNEAVKRIINDYKYCPFYGSDSIQVLKAAAALAIKNSIVPVTEFKRETDVTHKGSVNEELQAFMCVIQYSVEPKNDLQYLLDRSAVTKTFEQYAQAGLSSLETMCSSMTSMDDFKRMLDESN